MKRIIVFIAFLFCGCYTQTTITETPTYYHKPVSDINIVFSHDLWYWGSGHYWVINNKHPNRRELAIEKRTHRLYMGPRTHNWMPLPLASRVR